MANADIEQTEALAPETETLKKSLDLEAILQQEVGQFGWYQVRNILLALLTVIFIAWSNNSYIFITARIPTRCHIPECDVQEPDFNAMWILNAIPGTSLSSFDSCHRFSNVTALQLDRNVCPAILFDRSQIRSCERYVYQNTHTVVYDFNLGCDEWRRTLIGSIRIFGTLFTQLFTGLISDRWGRRTALVFNSFNSAWIGIAKYISNSYISFTILEFTQATFGGGTFQCAYILMTEMVGSKNRVLTSTFLNTTLSLGIAMLGLAAWDVPNWRLLTLVLHVPQLITISYHWLMGESVRWYVSKGRYRDCVKTLKNIARANSKHLSYKSCEVLRKLAEDEMEEQKPQSPEKDQRINEPSLMKLLFKHKPILLRCAITPFLWITFSFIFKGLMINAVDISGNKYVNYMAVAVSQIPGFWIAYLFLDKFGRKPTLTAAYWICAACQTGYIFMPKNQYFLSLILYLIGTSCSAAMLGALYIYTVELYPTQYRHRLFAFSAMMGRCGSIFSPLTPALGALIWDKLPFALFAVCAYVAGGLVLLMPETRGSRLPDTMQEAADLDKKSLSRRSTGL